METLTALGPGRVRTKYFWSGLVTAPLDAGWVWTEEFSLVPPLDGTINASLENQNVFLNPK